MLQAKIRHRAYNNKIGLYKKAESNKMGDKLPPIKLKQNE